MFRDIEIGKYRERMERRRQREAVRKKDEVAGEAKKEI